MEKAINIQTKESHLKTLYIRNSLQEQSSSSQEEGKMFQQPSFLQNMPKNTIQFMATIHRILQCFLETLRFTVAVLPGLASAARKGQQQTPSRAVSAGNCLLPSKEVCRPGCGSQLVLLQVVQLHVAQVNVILHRKLGQKVMLEPQMTNGFIRKANSRVPDSSLALVPIITWMGNQRTWARRWGWGQVQGRLTNAA